jgi:CheY-like chemotaxis protein
MTTIIEPKELPLKILIVDQEQSAIRSLLQTLEHEASVLTMNVALSLADARQMLTQNDFNSIFIDPLTLGLDAASKFIFETRQNLPDIVFTLYLDRSLAEAQRTEFYKGERRRFSHYHHLDKRTPVAAFSDEVHAVLNRAQRYLLRRISKTSLDQLRRDAEHLTESKSTDAQTQLLAEVRSLISKINPAIWDEKKDVKKNTVFLSYRFAEEDYIKGLQILLKQNGFEVVTGQSGNSYISKAVLDRIRECEFFLCLMTRHEEKAGGDYTTSPWLLEEKGAAVAFGKPLVLMIEEGVTDIGGLQGDWQRIHFSPKGFLYAALEAVKQLKSYQGDEEPTHRI